ncbi:hypothetical protein [Marinomonas balearica]|uniref:Uncharacterized protein n=1 Tax=Marinomonas balearica TaxID=491947 RepID=A0A4R6ME41_9GAMM|nr:hypothetical protein [Marinomonas balearica]TDP00032.1 hypothetical protein DFP79_1051 [Marinomonas balearica]
MARKANISREEIISACWHLLEQNHFPNIPRLAAHFFALDGRKCSNTTLLNGVTEWEELYHEHKKNELSELDSLIDPALKRFSRDITQTLAILFDEKTADIEEHFSLKEGSLSGQYLSLSNVVAEQEKEIEKLSSENIELNTENRLLKQELSQTSAQLDNQLSQSRVFQSLISKQEAELKEQSLNVAQREVDLAKQDAKIQSLLEDNQKLASQLERQQQSSQHNHQQMLLIEQLISKVGGLEQSMIELDNKGAAKN